MSNAQIQAHLHDLHSKDQWKLTLSKDWDVLGPFPLHAREQHFLSPSFPVDLLESINYDGCWPSSYADNAVVRWSNAQLSEDGTLEISFPQIRWENLRRTEGWAALQHHAVLRGTLTLTPPDTATSPETIPLRLRVHLKQGSYFSILPTERDGLIPEWYSGDIYNMERALPRIVNLPVPPDPVVATQYDIFISGDYEIRLFGDPLRNNTEIPTQVINLALEIEHPSGPVQHEPSQDVLCDFVDGYAFGNALGIGFRGMRDWAIINRVRSRLPGINLELKHPIKIAPSQLRVVPLIISQDNPFYGNELGVTVTVFCESGQEQHILISLPVKQQSTARSHDLRAFKATYFFGDAMPTAFLAIPPIGQPRISHPPVLALRNYTSDASLMNAQLHLPDGAGVDVVDQTFWAESLPHNNLSWTILPSGRTSWGLDWHGPSAQDAWDCVDVLPDILRQFSAWKDSSYKVGTSVILLGHSNGGQGAWWLGSRYPDRILAIIPAAGYIKSQAYVPLTMSRSAHFIDPALRGILESSLTPDDNDIFLTNVINKPVLVIHGGNDDNVPVWHGRELFSIVRTWSSLYGVRQNIAMKEDAGQGHWYPTAFNNPQVTEFISKLLEQYECRKSPRPLVPFTLTVVRPEESGSLEGWKIEEVKCPGRLARLTVIPSINGILEVRTANVRRFSVGQALEASSTFLIDGNEFEFDLTARGSILHFERDLASYKWELLVAGDTSTPSPPTRLQSFLSTKGPITFIPLTSGTAREYGARMSLAIRLAYDLHVYHRLDADINRDHEAIGRGDPGDWPRFNVVLIGSLKHPLIQNVLRQNKTSLGLTDGQLILNGRPIRTHPSTGIILLHPHPTSPDALMMLMIGESGGALERIGRLFPIRTGVATPSWIILGPSVDKLGAAGIVGAGVWGHGWTWNEAFSWFEDL